MIDCLSIDGTTGGSSPAVLAVTGVNVWCAGVEAGKFRCALCRSTGTDVKPGSHLSPMVGDLLYSLETNKTFYRPTTTNNGHRRFLRQV